MAYGEGDSRIPCKRLAMIGKSLVVGAKKLLREVKVEKVEDTVEVRDWFLNGVRGTHQSSPDGRTSIVYWPGSSVNFAGEVLNSVLYHNDRPLFFVSGDEQYISGYWADGSPTYSQKYAYKESVNSGEWKGEYEMYENGFPVGKIDITPSSLPEYRIVNTSTSTSYEVASDNDYDTFPNGRPEEEE